MSKSSSPASSDATFLPVIGSTILVNAGLSLVRTFFYGFYFTILFYCVQSQLRQRPINKAKKTLLLVTILLFLSCTIIFIIDNVVDLRFISNTLVKHPDVSLPAKLGSFDALTGNLMVFSGFLKSINYFTSDAVVVWRAWALWQGRRKVMIPLFVLLFGTFISGFLFASMMAAYSSHPQLKNVVDIVGMLSLLFSLITNIAGTSLIGYKAWLHRKFLDSHVHRRSGSSRTEKTLVIIIESGLIYCLLFVAYIAMQMLAANKNAWEPISIAYGVINAMGSQLSGLYPTIVVALVSMQNSAVEALGLGVTEEDYLKPLESGTSCSMGLTFTKHTGHSLEIPPPVYSDACDFASRSKAKTYEDTKQRRVDLREQPAFRGLKT